jgi:hypothetical protein
VREAKSQRVRVEVGSAGKAFLVRLPDGSLAVVPRPEDVLRIAAAWPDALIDWGGTPAPNPESEEAA